MISPELFEAARQGDRRALARAISQIESDPDVAGLERNQSVPVVGITGPPGVGKSTLVNSLITRLRESGVKLSVVAVDPSSPITGGALLGDRIRMQQHVDDAGVFVRSMASRGHLGGLSIATEQIVNLLSQSGFDLVLIETVGVGQSEVEVMDIADRVILVLAPGWGDQIQADKAGIVEIADVFVINKSDRGGVEPLHRSLAEIARSGQQERPIVVTNAISGDGVGELADLIGATGL